MLVQTTLHLRICIAAPPEKGAANRAIATLLAKTLGIPPSGIQLVRGATSPYKLFHIRPWSQALAAKLPIPPQSPDLFAAQKPHGLI